MRKKIDLKIIFVVLLMVAVTIFLLFINSFLYTKTNLLIFYFFDVWCKDSLCAWICIFIVFLYIVYEMKKENKIVNLTKPFLIFFAVSIVGMLIVNLFPVSKSYNDIMINGKKPSRLEYKFNILCDAISGKTKKNTILIEDIDIYENHYSYRVNRHRKGANSYYISFVVGINKYSSVEQYKTIKCIDEIIECSDSIELEYYPNSGIIKSINGIEKNDYKLLAYNADKIENDKKEEQTNNKQNEIIAYSIMSECVGNSLADVRNMFEEFEIEFEYDVIYISSQMYEIDEIAFYKGEEVYVVKDNSQEDLVALPTLGTGMTKQEVIDALEEVGLSYECDTFSCDMCGKNRLHTVGVAPGTLLPKGYKVWFSVDE